MEVQAALEELATYILVQARSEQNRDILRPGEETVFRWKLNQFEYSEAGVTSHSANGEFLTRPSWDIASMQFAKLIEASEPFRSTLSNLSALPEEMQASQALGRFVRIVTFEALSNPGAAPERARKLSSAFTRELRREPIEYGGEAELEGIAVLVPELSFSTGTNRISLRPTSKEDLEKEVRTFNTLVTPRSVMPSSIMTLSFMGRSARDVQERLEQSVAILRLYKVGGIRWYSVRLLSDSLTDFASSSVIHSGDIHRAYERYAIHESEVARLSAFWEALERTLPYDLYELTDTAITPLSIGYKRYCDALLHNGMFERRVANAVMGLEALLLGGETQDLSYRLRMRAAKLLSHVGGDSSRVKDTLSDAYWIRSVYVHGGHVTDRDKRKLTRVYATLNGLTALVMDYLRMALVCFILMRRPKDEIIEMVDDSMIDREKDRQLEIVMGSVKRIAPAG